MSAATQRTFGGTVSGSRRATPTISSTDGSDARAVIVLVPTFPVAPTTTTRMRHGYPGIPRLTPNPNQGEIDGRTDDTGGEAGRGDRPGAGGAGRHEEGGGTRRGRRHGRRAAAHARGGRGDRAPLHAAG